MQSTQPSEVTFLAAENRIIIQRRKRHMGKGRMMTQWKIHLLEIHYWRPVKERVRWHERVPVLFPSVHGFYFGEKRRTIKFLLFPVYQQTKKWFIFTVHGEDGGEESRFIPCQASALYTVFLLGGHFIISIIIPFTKPRKLYRDDFFHALPLHREDCNLTHTQRPAITSHLLAWFPLWIWDG